MTTQNPADTYRTSTTNSHLDAVFVTLEEHALASPTNRLHAARSHKRPPGYGGPVRVVS